MSLIVQPTPSNIKRAVRALMNGDLVGLPTETVYGLAADAENEIAVNRVYTVKGRPRSHPLIVHIGSIEYLDKWAIEIPGYAHELAENFWPGPMTLILKPSGIAKDFVTGGQYSVGLRIPSHSIALNLLKSFHEHGGNGLAAPSANMFGAVSPTNARSVEIEIGKKMNATSDLILEGGASQIGLESTIVNCLQSEAQILRPGAITNFHIEKTLGIKLGKKSENENIKFSGIFSSHYAPRATVIYQGKTLEGDGFLALKNVETPHGCIRLAKPINSFEFARCLYSVFRMADERRLHRLFVVLPVGEGIEVAIADRVSKASAMKNKLIV